MKNFLFATFISIIAFAACTKNNDQLAGTDATLSKSADRQVAQTPVQMLTAHEWIYQGYYSHYTDEQHKGQRFYDRDSTGNLDQYLSRAVFTFTGDHKFTERVSPYLYKGHWAFTDKVPTFLVLKYSFRTDMDSILLFNADHLNYNRKDGYSQWHTELIPGNG